MSESKDNMSLTSWPCPHCQSQIELAGPKDKEWCFARCHSCGGLTLIEGNAPKLRWSEPDPDWKNLIDSSQQEKIATLPTRPSFIEVVSAPAQMQGAIQVIAEKTKLPVARPALTPPPFRPSATQAPVTPPPFKKPMLSRPPPNPTRTQTIARSSDAERDQLQIRVDSWLPDQN